MAINRDVTLWTYQNFDGSNQTTVMYNYNFKNFQKSKDGENKNGNVSITLGVGLDTDFHKTGFIADGKVNYKFGKHSGLQFRARTRNGEDYNKFQGRLALTESFKVAKGTSIYITPYGALNADCNTGAVKPNLGIFFGGEYQIDEHWSIAGEAQRYNLQDPATQDGNWSGNFKLGYKF